MQRLAALKSKMSGNHKAVCLSPLEFAPGENEIKARAVSEKSSRLGLRVGDYQCTRAIGVGVAGEVFAANIQGQEVALKVVDGTKRPHIVRNIKKEVAIHTFCHDHPNVLTCYDFMHMGDKFFLVAELASQGDAFDFVQDCGGVFTERVARNFISQLLAGVAHLHSLGVCHRDIKPENLLVTDEGTRLQLCDFGYAIQWTEKDRFRTDPAGTVRCLSPEMVAGLYDPAKGDIWACGIVLYYFLTGQFPFDGADDAATTKNIQRRIFTTPLHSSLSKEARDLVLKMLEPIPDQRPSAKELLDHPFITQRRISLSV